MFPDDCVQSIIGAGHWWEKNSEQRVCRGALIFAFVPHVDQVPYTFEPVGRIDPTRHEDAVLRVSPLKTNLPLKPTDLPVAAMTLHSGEVWAAYRAKKRPCLVLAAGNPPVNRQLTRGKPNSSTAPTLLVAPYYGATRNSRRAGYSPEFAERVRHCEYPQFHWDILPIPGGEESILRLDHLQPIGAHPSSYLLSDFRLSEGAVEIMDELLGWITSGGVEEDSLVAMYRNEIDATFDATS
jgi:hypothetical protein